MPTAQIHLERLIGRTVRSREGERVGRIEEVRVEREGSEWTVVEYHLGPSALLERLTAPLLHLPLLRTLGETPGRHSFRVRWDQLDVSDPARPRLTCPIDEIRHLPH